MKHFFNTSAILTALIVLLFCLPSQAADSEKMLAKGQVIVWNSTDDGCCVLRGDIDGDGVVTPLDALCLVQNIWSIYPPVCTPDCWEEADVNCSGSVDPLDAVDLISYLYRGGPAPCDCP